MTDSMPPLFSNAWFRRLNFLATVILPGIAGLYFGIAQIWGLPKAEEVVGTITVFTTFLGLLLKASSVQYDRSDAKYSGVIEVREDEDKVRYLAGVRDGVDDLANKGEALFKVEVVQDDDHVGRHEAK